MATGLCPLDVAVLLVRTEGANIRRLPNARGFRPSCTQGPLRITIPAEHA